jgi:hypothetical protein
MVRTLITLTVSVPENVPPLRVVPHKVSSAVLVVGCPWESRQNRALQGDSDSRKASHGRLTRHGSEARA